MAQFRGERNAFGAPGLTPTWTAGDKDGVGTAYSAASRVWFTLWRGILTEAYYPTVDRPQMRDLYFMLTDGATFLHREQSEMDCVVETISDSLGYRVHRSGPNKRYTITKEIVSDPHSACILQHSHIEGDGEFLKQCRLYVSCNPHLEGGGAGNDAYVVRASGRDLLLARKNDRWLAIGATCPFARLSCGYAGISDGLSDLAQDFRMKWEFDRAVDGNVSLTAEIDLSAHREFTLGIAFGDGINSVIAKLFQGLGIPFEDQKSRFTEQWHRAASGWLPLEAKSCDGGRLLKMSRNVLLAHEDKTYQGAFIASLSIPWGEARGDEDGLAGYHLVWTRDMVKSATALLAAGDKETPLRSLMYLAASQMDDGCFPQNFWIDGKPNADHTQLDEVAMPVLLARHLFREDALQDFDPTCMVMQAAAFLLEFGPVTRQERWEEAHGLSPSTMAGIIAAFLSAACFAREKGHEETALFFEEYADWLRSHLRDWVVARPDPENDKASGSFARINPVKHGDTAEDCPIENAAMTIKNLAPDQQCDFPAREIVDGGFLDIVRYGILAADDPLILRTVTVVDRLLKIETPFGPCWHRYNHDGYGQQDDGEPFRKHGVGRAWPLLTAERAHYELAAGHDIAPLLRAMEKFASPTGLLSEQVWDAPDKPEVEMFLGRPTGTAMPLLWAHSEYVKLLRSAADGKIYDLIPEIAERYRGLKLQRNKLEVWSFVYQSKSVQSGQILRIVARKAFHLRWTADHWKSEEDKTSVSIGMSVYFVDLPTSQTRTASIRFKFFWSETDAWEPRHFEVKVTEAQIN